MGSPRRQEGGGRFLLKIPGGGGVFLLKIPGGGGEREGPRGREVSAANWGILGGGGGLNIFWGPKRPPSPVSKIFKNKRKTKCDRGCDS